MEGNNEERSKGITIDLSNKRINNIDNIIELVNDPSHVKRLILENNAISALPKDLSLFENAEYINIAKNPLADYTQTSSILSSLPLLKELVIDLKSTEDAAVLIQALPQLELLNGKKTQQDAHCSMKQSFELEIIEMNGVIRRLCSFMKNSKEELEVFAFDFEELIKQQIEVINMPVPMHIYEIGVLNSKVVLYSFLQEVMMTMLFDNAKDKDLIRLFADVNRRIKELQFVLKDKLIKTQQESFELLMRDSKRKDDIINGLRQELEEAKKQLKLFSNEKKAIDSENKLLTETITKVKHENKQMTSKIFSIVNDLASSSILTPNESIEQRTKEVNESPLHKQSLNSLSPQAKSANSSKRIRASSTSKEISENQLLDIIDAIYKSKANSDKVNHDAHFPIETLEQHMYTFLNQKYGLKKLIIENASSIINAVKLYSITNSEVCLFGKVLRNEIDEESIAIMKGLKAVLSQLILKIIKEDNLNYAQEQISQCYELIKANEKPLKKEMIEVILQFIFAQDTEGHEAISSKIKGKLSNSSNKAVTNYELYNLILEHHIRARSSYLEPFVIAFRGVDNDSNGIINQEELRKLLQRFFEKEMTSSAITTLIEKLDQFNLKQFTFSQVVAFLQKTPLNSKDPSSLLALISFRPIDF